MENGTKLKRVLGFGATYGAAMGLVVSGTAMFSVTQVAGQSSYAVVVTGLIGLIPIICAALAFSELSAMLPGGGMIDKITTYDEYLASDEMARKRTVFTADKEDEEIED